MPVLIGKSMANHATSHVSVTLGSPVKRSSSFQPVGGEDVRYWPGSPLLQQFILFFCPFVLNPSGETSSKLDDLFNVLFPLSPGIHAGDAVHDVRRH